MSEVRLNIIDASRAICGTIHGSEGDAAVAALSAEPETIEELQDALARFIKPVDDCEPFAMFFAGTSDEPWDAGILFIDLAARVVAVESSYSLPSSGGQVSYHDAVRATDLLLPYQVPDDWLFFDSVAEYKEVSDGRRAERAAAPPLDFRPILYGAVLKFVVNQCLAARVSNAEDPIAEIHAKWLMTPRADLRGQSPREMILRKREFIDADLQSRELQWSFVGEPAPCLKPESNAYRFAGFGTHEVVVYYKLLRHLISKCWKRVKKGKGVTIPEEVARLQKIKADWLERIQHDLGVRSPVYIIECERKRLPLIVSAEEAAIDDDCPLCKSMGKACTPWFSHLDGCNMDNDFPFSFCCTRDEWEEEELGRKQFNDEFNRKWEQRSGEALADADDPMIQ